MTAPPPAAWAGSTDPLAPLIVLFHGRGSNEREILSLAASLPNEFAYAALRGPEELEPGNYAWFQNRGIGRPLAESLRTNLDWFFAWLDEVAPRGRPVALIGFSGGAAFVGGAVLDRPTRVTAAAILYGTVPFDAGLSTVPHQLAGVSIFHAQGIDDPVMPPDLMERTWHYLTTESGAELETHRTAGGHAIHPSVMESLAHWLTERLEPRVTS